MSRGKHRRRHYRRAFIAAGVAALAVLGTGVGFAMAQTPPAAVTIAGDPVIAPEPAVSPVASQSPPAPKIYVAREGDTLWSVASQQCHDGRKWNVLASANRIREPYPVLPGQRLTVEC